MNAEQHIIANLRDLPVPCIPRMENIFTHNVQNGLSACKGFGRPAAHKGERARRCAANAA